MRALPSRVQLVFLELVLVDHPDGALRAGRRRGRAASAICSDIASCAPAGSSRSTGLSFGDAGDALACPSRTSGRRRAPLSSIAARSVSGTTAPSTIENVLDLRERVRKRHAEQAARACSSTSRCRSSAPARSSSSVEVPARHAFPFDGVGGAERLEVGGSAAARRRCRSSDEHAEQAFRQPHRFPR